MAETPAPQDWGDSGNSAITIGSTPAYESDQFFYRVVAISLGTAIVLSVLGSVVLAFYEKDSEALLAIGSAAVGALAGVLAGRR